MIELNQCAFLNFLFYRISLLSLRSIKSNNRHFTTGSLDHHPDIKPNENIFWADKAVWNKPGVLAVKCAGYSK